MNDLLDGIDLNGAATDHQINQAMAEKGARVIGLGNMTVTTAIMAKFMPYSAQFSGEYAFQRGVGPSKELTFVFDLTNAPLPEYMGLIGDTYGHIEEQRCHCKGAQEIMKPTLSGCGSYDNWLNQICGKPVVVSDYQVVVTNATNPGATDVDFSIYVDSANATKHMNMETTSMLGHISPMQQSRDIMRHKFDQAFIMSGNEGVMLGTLKKGFCYKITLYFMGEIM